MKFIKNYLIAVAWMLVILTVIAGIAAALVAYPMLTLIALLFGVIPATVAGLVDESGW